MAKRRFKITKEDFYVWEIISDEQARKIFASGEEEVFILYDDDSEGLVESDEELDKAIERGCTFGIGLGFVSREKEIMDEVQNIKGYTCLSCEDKDGNIYKAVIDIPFSEMKVLRDKFPNNVSIEILTANVNLNFDLLKRTGLTAEKEFEMDAIRLNANRVFHNDTGFLNWFKAEVAALQTKDDYLRLVDMAEEIHEYMLMYKDKEYSIGIFDNEFEVFDRYVTDYVDGANGIHYYIGIVIDGN